MEYQRVKQIYSFLPNLPGVYQMLNKHGEVIYVGKAKDLKKRVGSYFVATGKKEIKTQVLVSQIVDIKVVVTHTEQDALILENKLIKRLKPRYNIALKDDKSYPYIKITIHEPFPRVLITRDKKNDRALYFGPYASIGSSKMLQKTVTDVFPIRECTKPITLDKMQKKCINLDIGKCLGPCINKAVKPEYDDLINSIKMLIKGQNNDTIAKIKKKMNHASEKLQFERAGILRDQLAKIELIQRAQKVSGNDKINANIWIYLQTDQLHYAFLQVVENGVIVSQKGYFEKKDAIDKAGFISKTVMDVFETANWVADEISGNEAIYTELVEVFRPLDLEVNITVTSPKRGAKKQLVESAEKTAHIALMKLAYTDAPNTDETEDTVSDLQDSLSLINRPDHILGVDISHLQGQLIVASCVDFKEGRPDKSGYRKFNITQVQDKSNDPLSIYEVVKRRVSGCIAEGVLPDLIVVDGGIGQLNFAYRALTELKVDHLVDLISLAKRQEQVYKIGHPTPIQLGNTKARRLLQHIRDESHRFAVTFQRLKRQKRVENSILLKIPGIGQKTLNKLYQHFKSLDKMKESSIADLAKVGNISPKLATQIMDILTNV